MEPLYELALRAGEWQVTPELAHIVTTARELAAFHQEDYALVHHLAQSYLAHPGLSKRDADDVTYHKVRSGIAQILIDDIDAGVATLTSVLRTYERKSHFWPLEIVRLLRGVCSVKPAHELVPEPLLTLSRALVRRLHAYFMGRQLPSTPLTYGHLLELISAPKRVPISE